MAYVFIKMANSPRPGVFALEKSTDYGMTWEAWQYFADTQSDCNTFFGEADYETSISRDDSVLCTTEYSKVVPLEGGEVSIPFMKKVNFSSIFFTVQHLGDRKVDYKPIIIIIYFLTSAMLDYIIQFFSQIVVSLVNGRPNAMNFSNSPSLQEWTKATNVRLRLLRTKTLLGHLMAVANQDPTVTRRVSKNKWK